jgi:hypothetical protein
MEFVLVFALILIAAIGGGVIVWAWTRDREDPVERLLRRTFVNDGVLHIKGGPLTSEQAREIKDAWERQYPFRRRAF